MLLINRFWIKIWTSRVLSKNYFFAQINERYGSVNLTHNATKIVAWVTYHHPVSLYVTDKKHQEELESFANALAKKLDREVLVSFGRIPAPDN